MITMFSMIHTMIRAWSSCFSCFFFEKKGLFVNVFITSCCHIPFYGTFDWPYPSREHIGNIDDSLLLSSITSLMHQFYIEHRKYWWIFDLTLMFHPCFQCFFYIETSDVPSTKHQWFIDETSMFHRLAH